MIKVALIKKLEGEIEVAKADLRTFLANPIGVAEHIDYVITAEKKLEALAHAEDKLESFKQSSNDIHCQRQVYNVQTHRLCGSVSSGLLLRGREHAGDQSRRVH